MDIAVEWLDAGEVRTPELAATWCRLEVGVDGRTVTAVDDLRTGSPRRGIYCSAYPLAEWIATSWWGIRSHVPRGAPSKSERSAWHDARAASDGFTWPLLTIHPAGELTHLRWKADVAARGVIRYLSAGDAWVDSALVQTQLSAFVDDVIDKLVSVGIRDTLLQDEWMAIRSADGDEAAVCDTAAALGLDPYDLSPESERQVLELRTVLGDELARELASASTPERLQRDTQWATRSLKSLGNVSAEAATLDALSVMSAETIDRPHDRPWEIGWDRARALRRTLGWPPDARVDLTRLVHAHRAVTVDNEGLFGVAGMRQDGVHVVPASGGIASRFTAARALHGTARRPERPVLITASRTYEAAVERAFAAELLAPRDGLSQLLESKYIVSDNDVSALARHFAAPAMAIRHQLSNQLGFDVV